MKNRIFYHLFLFVLLNAFLACKFPGTDTGNPVVPKQDQQICEANSKKTPSEIQPRCTQLSEPEVVVANICQKITSCYPIEISSCISTLMEQIGLKFEIELDFETYAQLHEAYKQGQVVAQLENMNQCLSAIKELDCKSSIVENLIELENGIPNYSNTHSIHRVDSSCRIMFSSID